MIIDLKKLLIYLSTIVIGIFYMIYFDSKFGIPVICVLLIMPIISFVLIKLASMGIEIKVYSQHEMVNKSDEIEVFVEIISRGIMPIPFLFIEIYSDGNINTTGTKKFIMPVLVNESNKIVKIFTAQIWGHARVGIKEVSVLDYFGLYKINYIDESNYYMYTKSIKVCPALVESKSSDLILSILSDNAYSEEEEEIDNSSNSFFVTPGYEHREYVPGDPLKQINWKLSAKKDIYMVREFEKLGSSTPVFVLDHKGIDNKSIDNDNLLIFNLIIEERTIESFLSMMDNMVKLGMTSKSHYYKNDWQSIDIESIDNIYYLQNEFSDFKFTDPREIKTIERIPNYVLEESSIIVIFTCNMDEELIQCIENIKQKGILVYVVCSRETTLFCENMWKVNEAYEFIDIGGDRT